MAYQRLVCVVIHMLKRVHLLKGTLYTRLGTVEVEYHETLCSAGECKLLFTVGAEEKSIFLKTSFTTAGDEIGWDLVEAVCKTRCSFSSFCNEMTRRYQTTNIMAGPFMSPNNFISCFFVGYLLSRLISGKSTTPGVAVNHLSLPVMEHTSASPLET